MPGMRSADQDVDVDLGMLFASLKRDWRRIFAVTVLVGAAALGLTMLATPQYRAETRILIETRESIYTRPEQAAGENDSSLLDEEGVTSQVDLIGSSDLLRQVAQKLNLASREEFEDGGSVVHSLLVLTGLASDRPADAAAAEERVLTLFREKLQVYRVEKSRVIVVEFSSSDPKLAADVSNAVADAYIGLQRDAKLLSNSEATAWLEPAIADLRDKVKEAEARVATYRSQSDLLIGQNNSVLATQQLSELSSELSRVRAARGAAEAKAASMRAALKAGASLDTVPEVLSSGLIQRLRERQVQLNADIADLSATLLDNHPRLKALRSQLADLNGQIRSESGKVLQGLETEAQTARFRETDLIGVLNGLKVESSRAGDQEVELRALEREATSQRQLLESYLTSYREAASRGDANYLPADARIFSRASVPSEPYYPKVLPTAIAAAVGALILMIVITLLRELFSGRAMRPAGGVSEKPSVEADMIPLVATPPMAPVTEAEPVLAKSAAEDFAAEPETADDPVAPPEPVVADHQPAVDARPAAPSLQPAAPSPQPAAPLVRPASPLLRPGQVSVATAAERLIASAASRAVMVSPEGDEAAATAVLIAREIADAGLRVVLLDLTASGAASRPMLDTASRPGITNLLVSEAQFTDVIHSDHYSACHVIPTGTADHGKAMRAADRLPIILASLSTAYDMVVVECGQATSQSIGRLAADGAVVLVSCIEAADDSIGQTQADLTAGGFEDLILVSPVGALPSPTMPDRSAA